MSYYFWIGNQFSLLPLSPHPFSLFSKKVPARSLCRQLGCFPGCPPGFIARVAQVTCDGWFCGLFVAAFRAQKTSHSHVFLVYKGGAGLLTTALWVQSLWNQRAGGREGLRFPPWSICSLLMTVAALHWSCSRILSGKICRRLPQPTAPLGNVLVVFLSQGAICDQGYHIGHQPSMMCHEEATGHRACCEPPGPLHRRWRQSCPWSPGAQQDWTNLRLLIGQLKCILILGE